MEMGHHVYLGETTGNPLQPPGKHRDLALPKGRGMFPLGDRTRDVTAYGVDFFEERISLDKYSKYTS